MDKLRAYTNEEWDEVHPHLVLDAIVWTVMLESPAYSRSCLNARLYMYS